MITLPAFISQENVHDLPTQNFFKMLISVKITPLQVNYNIITAVKNTILI